MTSRYTVYVVPHTHWDRAWYVPFEEFRLRLLRMVDRLCHTLETDPRFTCFTLDGQAITLEDYLAIRPYQEERLRKLVKAKRLFVGPWYVLPDEFLVSPESLVRNLLYGGMLSRSFGHTMSVGYVPDSFGHIAQLPQILRGFELDSFVFFRGIDQPATKTRVEFEWRAPDGSAVLASQQRPFYGNGTHLGYITNWGDTEGMVQDPSFAIKQIRQSCDLLREHSELHSLLLGNGIDQSEHQPELPRILDGLEPHFPEYAFRIASYEDYIAGVKRDPKTGHLQTVKGELCYPYGDMLRGVNSSRMYLKMKNQHCEDLLEKWCEPVVTAAWLLKCEAYPKDELRHAWRELMKTHPHDDVCGASVDQVHREDEIRLDAVEQVGHMLYRTSLRRLALNTDHSKCDGVPVMVFNTLAMPRKELLRIDVDLKPEEEPWKTVKLFDEDGREVPCTLVTHERKHWWEALKPFDVHRHTLEVDLDLPAFGYRTLYARPGRPRPVEPRIKVGKSTFENECFALSIGPDGALALRDKTTNRRYRNLLVFEDTEDCGDEYNWSYLRKGSQTFTTKNARARISVAYRSPFSITWRITHELRIPESLTPDHTARSPRKTTLTIVSEVTCKAGSPRVDVLTRVTNNVLDHRLRALFPTAIETDEVCVDGHFAVIQRGVKLPPPKKDLPTYPTQHQLRFADLNDGVAGFAIMNDGLPEFEVVCQGKRRVLAQTLYRSVGWLGRDDFPTRPFSASPILPCPEAQCLRPMEFRYAFMAHSDGWAPVMQEALRHNIGVCVTRSDIHGGTDLLQMGIALDEERATQQYLPVSRKGKLDDRGCLMDLGSSEVVLSAFKKCEWNNNLIVRFYNPGNGPLKGTLTMFKPIRKAFLTNLNEKRKEQLPVSNGAVRYTLPGQRILTLELAL